MIPKLNRKGSVADSIYVPIYILIIACTIFVAYYVWITFATNFTSLSDTIILPDNRNLTAITSEITGSIATLDYMFPVIVLGLLIVSLIFAFRTGASVVYAYVSVFMWVLALIMSAVFANIFEAFAANFPTVSPVFPIVSFIMANIKWIVLGWAFLISVVMFTRNKQEDQTLAAAERVFT